MLSLWFTNSKVHLGGDGTGYIALHLGLGVSWFLEFNCDLLMFVKPFSIPSHSISRAMPNFFS